MNNAVTATLGLHAAKAGLYAPPKRHWGDWLFFGACGYLLWAGWLNRHDTYLLPEQGLGYALGIVGGLLMLLLLLYPLRKQARWMRNMGPVKYWFRAHMYSGILGPLAILYHCNFQFGATNSNVALLCMLTVAGSGLIGRYLYTRVHYGLYDSKLSLVQLRNHTLASRAHLATVFAELPELDARLKRLEADAIAPPSGGMLRNLPHLFVLGFRTHLAGFAADRLLARHIPQRAQRAEVRRFVANHLTVVRRTAGFGIFERLLSWWHVLHLPLFVMLVLAGIVHVVATHWLY